MSDINDEMQGCSVRLCAFEYYNPYEGADDEPIDEEDEDACADSDDVLFQPRGADL